MINADKPTNWPADIDLSVAQYNQWFLRFAPKTFQDTRQKVVVHVEDAMKVSGDLTVLTAAVVRANPQILPTLRMCCCPPIARDRLSGLAGVPKTLVKTLEEGSLPKAKPGLKALDDNLGKIVAVLRTLLDDDLFPWVKGGAQPSKDERHRAAHVVADRLCASVADPIVRNAQEKRQQDEIQAYLVAKGYTRQRPKAPFTTMQPGTFEFIVNVSVNTPSGSVTIPVDAMIQPLILRPSKLPVMVECKSAGDFTNTNKRQKEEGQKGRQLRDEFKSDLCYVLFLCGYFGKKYLQYEAREQFDWIWEHRISDMDQLGL